jgi:hypothetical protein
MNSISENLQRVRQAIAKTAEAARRDPQEVRLIAVSKTFPAERVLEAAAAGQMIFGENRVQEAAEKIPATDGRGLEWHMIGHLQSNKAHKAAQLFDWIHSVDSPRLLDKLNDGAAGRGRVLPVLLQVDLAKEPTKSGLLEEELEPALRRAESLSNLSIRGLMIIPPFLEDPEAVRPYFRRLRELRDCLAERQFPQVEMRELSMGMSHDFEAAIQEGATLSRVGTAIFGKRAKGK